jgi:hypothetical protein
MSGGRVASKEDFSDFVKNKNKKELKVFYFQE